MIYKKRISDYTKYFLDELSEYNDYEYKTENIDKVIDTWYQNKEQLLSKFIQHKNYNGNGQIVIEKDFVRSINKDDVLHYLCIIRDNYYENTQFNTQAEYDAADFLLLLIKMATEGYVKQYIDEAFIHRFNRDFPDIKIHEGGKTTRFLYGAFKKFNLDSLESFEKNFAAMADAINPISYKQYVVFSINPIDYLSMSNGNSWRSCHSLGNCDRGKGTYCSGTMSYMLDECSIVVYTLPKINKQPERLKKLNRQMVFIGNNYYMTSRLYPNNNDKEYKDQLEDVISCVVSKLLHKNNTWTKVEMDQCRSFINDYIVTKGTHYPDYMTNNYRDIFVKKRKHKKITIGHDPICPGCGKQHHRNRSIMCYNCTNDEYDFCESCGAEIDPNDCYEEGGYYFCNEDCASEYFDY